MSKKENRIAVRQAAEKAVIILIDIALVAVIVGRIIWL